MTESEMYLIRNLLLFDCEGKHTMFDERTDDKQLIFVTADEPTLLRYIIASPLTSNARREQAKSELYDLMEEDDSVSAVQQTPFECDDLVLYCAPKVGQPGDSQSPDSGVCPANPLELTFNDRIPETLLKVDPVYIDPFDTSTDTLSDGPRCDHQ